MECTVNGIMSTAPVKEIEEWLELNNIEYQGWTSITFSRWIIEDERDQVLFKLRWGI